MKQSLSLAEATDLSIQMASMVTDAKTVPANDLEIPALEPQHAFAKSKEMKEVGVDRISSAVLRGVSHEGRLIGRGV